MTEITADMDVAPEKQTNKKAPRDESVVNPGDLGAKLKACREEADLSVEQAAVEMRLSAVMVKAMEAENFSELPDPPYVRGYLRSYARLNGSDPKALIRTYELLRGVDPDSFAFTPTVPLNRVAKPRMSATTLKTLLLIFGVLLLGILSMIPGVSQWAGDTWRSFSAQTAESHPATIAAGNAAGEVERSSEANTSLATSTSDSATPAATDTSVTPAADAPLQTADASTTDASINNGEAPPPEADASQDLAAPAETGDETPSPDADLAAGDQNTADTTTDTPTDATDTTDATASTDPALISATAIPATADTATDPAQTAQTTATDAATPADQTAQAAASTDTSTVSPDAAAAAVPTPATTASTFSQPIDGEVVVRMEFTQEVWMQVKDGNKKSIFETLNTANTWKEFKTRTPLSFKIGNAPGVRVYLNGQLFDQTPHTRGSVARFTVD